MQGPSLIFDKSALQCLSFDEAVWLDNFYRCNITPLFFIETLADLEKEVAAGRTPEQVVGDIANKTPDWQSIANVRHTAVLWGELSGKHVVDFTMGRPTLGSGQPLMLNGQMGMFYRESQEEEALRRWQNREFLDIERQIAKQWRRGLSNVNPAEFASSMSRLLQGRKPTSFGEAKTIADEIIDLWEQQFALTLGLALVGVPKDFGSEVLKGWAAMGKPRLRDAYPYFCHVFGVDLTFYFATGSQLVRGASRPSNIVDIAYLYYLPFCCVFASGDRLHNNLAPLFMRPFQTFLTAQELKQEMKRLNEHYSALPEDTLRTGLMNFAATPPEGTEFITTQLWDKYLPAWRAKPGYRKGDLSPQIEDALHKMVKEWEKKAVPTEVPEDFQMDDIAQLTITKKISLRKGGWRRFSPQMEQSIIDGEKRNTETTD